MKESILVVPEDKELPTEESLTNEQRKELEKIIPKPIVKNIDLKTMIVTERSVNE